MVNPPYCFNGGLHPGLFVAGASPQRRPLAAPLSADLAAAGGTAHQKMDETICHAHMLHAWYIYPICGRFFGANVGISYMEHMAWGLTWFMQSVTYFFWALTWCQKYIYSYPINCRGLTCVQMV